MQTINLEEAKKMCKLPYKFSYLVRMGKIQSFVKKRNRYIILSDAMANIKQINAEYYEAISLEKGGWFNMSETARKLKRSLSTVSNWVSRGWLDFVVVGNKKYVSLKQVEVLSGSVKRHKSGVRLSDVAESVKIGKTGKVRIETLEELVSNLDKIYDMYDGIRKWVKENRRDIGQLYKFQGYYHIGQEIKEHSRGEGML